MAGVGGIQVKLVCEKSSDALKGAWIGGLHVFASAMLVGKGLQRLMSVDARIH